jgi:hypothetical protein
MRKILEPIRKEVESVELVVIMGWPAPLAAIP